MEQEYKMIYYGIFGEDEGLTEDYIFKDINKSLKECKEYCNENDLHFGNYLSYIKNDKKEKVKLIKLQEKQEENKIIYNDYLTLNTQDFYNKYRSIFNKTYSMLKKEYNILIKRPVKPKKIKEVKEPTLQGLNAWRKEKIESFKIDYLILSNKELSEKYNISTETVWRNGKILGLKRDKKYYNSVNIKNKKAFKLTEEEKRELKNFAENPFMLIKEIENILSLTYSTIKLYCKALNIDIKKRKIYKPNYTIKNLKKVKRDLLYYSNIEVCLKWNITEKHLKENKDKLIFLNNNTRYNMKLLKNDKLKCSKCGEEKHIDYFYLEKNNNIIKYGSLCKDCKREQRYKKQINNYLDFKSSDCEEIRSYFNFKCAYCGEPLKIKAETFDHVIPISKGGLHTKYNLVYCCIDCNNKKYINEPIFYNEEGKEKFYNWINKEV